MLDEECRFPQATDLTFLDKLQKNLAKHPNFEIPKTTKNIFTINHYAGKVQYTVDGMLEKNKDTLGEDIIGLLYCLRVVILTFMFRRIMLSSKCRVCTRNYVSTFPRPRKPSRPRART